MGGIFTASAARGYARYATLTSHRSFSFGDYHDPQRMGFGALRVLNEEILAPGASVPLHSHENMEILSLPLSGTLRHQDSRETRHVIAPGEVHLLSAGLGVTHWEFNHSASVPAHYLQLWIQPRAHRTPTTYGHGRIDASHMARGVHLVAAPAGGNGVVELNQDAWVSLATLAPTMSLAFQKHRDANGLYLFLIEGRMQVGEVLLARGDGFGLTETLLPQFTAMDASTVLCIEVPLEACTI